MLQKSAKPAYPINSDEWPHRLTRKYASLYLLTIHGISLQPGGLAKAAVKGNGPLFRKDGRAVIYDRAALDEWAEKRVSRQYRSNAEVFVSKQLNEGKHDTRKRKAA